jgi:hypothetical protein
MLRLRGFQSFRASSTVWWVKAPGRVSGAAERQSSSCSDPAAREGAFHESAKSVAQCRCVLRFFRPVRRPGGESSTWTSADGAEGCVVDAMKLHDTWRAVTLHQAVRAAAVP